MAHLHGYCKVSLSSSPCGPLHREEAKDDSWISPEWVTQGIREEAVMSLWPSLRSHISSFPCNPIMYTGRLHSVLYKTTKTTNNRGWARLGDSCHTRKGHCLKKWIVLSVKGNKLFYMTTYYFSTPNSPFSLTIPYTFSILNYYLFYFSELKVLLLFLFLPIFILQILLILPSPACKQISHCYLIWEVTMISFFFEQSWHIASHVLCICSLLCKWLFSVSYVSNTNLESKDTTINRNSLWWILYPIEVKKNK